MTNSMNRRDLLRLGSAGMLAGGVSTFFPGVAAGMQGIPGMDPVLLPTKLVVLFLRGGNDGCNTIIPWGDSDYANSVYRSNLTVPDSAAPGDEYYSRRLDLGPGGNTFARAHPGLKELVEPAGSPWLNGNLHFVQQVGHAQGSRSHFVEQQNYETTRLFAPNFTHGWLTRLGEKLGFHLINTPAYNPVGGISTSGKQQMSASGLPALNHIPLLSDFTRDPNNNPPDPQYVDLFTRLRQTYDRAPTAGHTWDELLRDTGKIMSDALAIIEPLGPYSPATNWTGFGPGHVFPSTQQQFDDLGLAYSPLSAGLMSNFRDITQLLKETPARICATEFASFDTHGNQKYAHLDLWGNVTHAARSLFEEIYNDPSTGNLWARTLLLVVSEFGRTGYENGSKGTDHGSGGVGIVMGGAVNGGVTNCDLASWGTGAPLNQGTMVQLGVGTARYQPVLTDFRDVYAEIVDRHFNFQGADLDYIVDDWSNQAPGNYVGFLP